MGRPIDNDSAKKYSEKKSRLFALNLTPTLWLSHTWNTVVVGAGHPVSHVPSDAVLPSPYPNPHHMPFGIGFYGTWMGGEGACMRRRGTAGRVCRVGVTVQEGLCIFDFVQLSDWGATPCVEVKARAHEGATRGGVYFKCYFKC